MTEQTLHDVLGLRSHGFKLNVLRFAINFKMGDPSKDLLVLKKFLGTNSEVSDAWICTKLPEEWLITLAESKTIKSLHLLQPPLTSKTINAIKGRLSSDTDLNELSIYGDSTTSITSIITALTDNTTLKTLRLHGVSLTSAEVCQIAHKKNLESLHLDDASPIDAVAARALCDNPTITHVTLHLTRESVSVFAEHQKECTLDLGYRTTLALGDVVTLIKNPHLNVIHLPEKYEQNDTVLESLYEKRLRQLEKDATSSSIKENINQLIAKIKEGYTKNEKKAELVKMLTCCSDYISKKTSSMYSYDREIHEIGSEERHSLPYWKALRAMAQTIPYDYEIKHLRAIESKYDASQSRLKDSVAYFIQKIEAGKKAGEPLTKLTDSLQLASCFLEGKISKEDYNKRKKRLVNTQTNPIFWACISGCLIAIGVMAAVFGVCLMITAPLPGVAIGLAGIGMVAAGVRFFNDRPLLSNKAANNLVKEKEALPSLSSVATF